jgi:hypothetical protein
VWSNADAEYLLNDTVYLNSEALRRGLAFCDIKKINLA